MHHALAKKKKHMGTARAPQTVERNSARFSWRLLRERGSVVMEMTTGTGHGHW